jgi:hypothetical protein
VTPAAQFTGNFGDWTYACLVEYRDAMLPHQRLSPQMTKETIQRCFEEWTKAKAPKRQKVILTDAAWLTELAADPASAGLDVHREHLNFLLWCKQHARMATRRAFTVWLTRADRKLDTPSGARKPASPALPEPKGWRAWVDANLAEDCVYGSNGTDKHLGWAAIPPYAQKVIADGMKA